MYKIWLKSFNSFRSYRANKKPGWTDAVCHARTQAFTEGRPTPKHNHIGDAGVKVDEKVELRTRVAAPVSASACLARYLSRLIFKSRLRGISGTMTSIRRHTPITTCCNNISIINYSSCSSSSSIN